MIDRSSLRRAYRQNEAECTSERIVQAAVSHGLHPKAAALATALVTQARTRKASGIDAFLQQFGLSTQEGIALMCLAEALLRVPDSATADALIRDKLAPIDWSEHLGESASTFVNAATFSLMLTGEVLARPDDHQAGLGKVLKRAVTRMGEPVIRQATLQAMKILGGQFVFGRTIGEAMKRAQTDLQNGISYSFDMLGEGAMTMDDAARYFAAYEHAITQLAKEAKGGFIKTPGISVKLSALYPKYDIFHAQAATEFLVPKVKALALRARDADMHFTIDAEEADRLELSMDIIEALAADDEIFQGNWGGFGLAIQAYSKRGVHMCDWAARLARQYGRRFMVRLVKGAYWDAEVKLSQVGGFADYPVFTRKVSTDVSYLACAGILLDASDVIYSAFATHNAYTIAAIKVLAEAKGKGGFEFQRLHGMGEDVYRALAQAEGAAHTLVRVYAPVGNHKDLLAYLVRRLLENGANSSFVNRMADADVPAEALATNPVAELSALEERRNPNIPLPTGIFGARKNSAGVDLADPLVREPLLQRLAAFDGRRWHAEASFPLGGGELRDVTSPQNRHVVGTVRHAAAEEVDAAITRASAAQASWNALGGVRRAELLARAADLFEANAEEFFALCQREAGKGLLDSVLEVREAVDFLRYYASEARRLFDAPVALPGPTGEENRLHLAGRGVFATISPWNFPLAIFIGPAAAALAAGNSVVAKPAPQTPLIAALAVRLCHEAGIPAEVFQLLPGAGEVGGLITSDTRVAGVAFTGSTATARAINRSLAARDGALATFVAETGGQNAMIVDSSALPEQVTRDVVASAFQSAGQRCSALRVLYVQDDVADTILEMIRGAFATLNIGDPGDFTTDVGPVIDAAAQNALNAHIAACAAAGNPVTQRELPPHAQLGSFVAPAIIEIGSISDLDKEHFGPILHVVRFKGGELAQVIDDINASGFGLTLGLHTRIDSVRAYVESRAKVGNFYVNRNQIGAVVESQPFGGEGLSGTGPKAGGPHYLARFAVERVVSIDTTAAGGNATLLAS